MISLTWTTIIPIRLMLATSLQLALVLLSLVLSMVSCRPGENPDAVYRAAREAAVDSAANTGAVLVQNARDEMQVRARDVKAQVNGALRDAGIPATDAKIIRMWESRSPGVWCGDVQHGSHGDAAPSEVRWALYKAHVMFAHDATLSSFDRATLDACNGKALRNFP